jgi:hypothetical protein
MALSDAYDKFLPITPSDTVSIDFPHDAIYVGVTGDIAAVTPDNVAIVFKGALAGSILPLRLKRVNATNTTATNLIALKQI